MKWKTHRIIAKILGKEFGLPPNLINLLIKGSIDPDIHPDYTYRIYGYKRFKVYRVAQPHHNAPTNLIMNYIWKARYAWLKEDLEDTMFNIGKALHYIQDKCVSKGFLGLFHESIEEKLSETKLANEYFTKEKTMAKSSPHFIKEIINSLNAEEEGERILKKALHISAIIMASIMSDKNIPEKLYNEYLHVKKRYKRKTFPIAIVIGLTSIVLFYSFLGLYTLFTGLLIGYTVQWLDRKYHYLKEEARWYGIY
jgi:hypothetical protein